MLLHELVCAEIAAFEEQLLCNGQFLKLCYLIMLHAAVNVLFPDGCEFDCGAARGIRSDVNSLLSTSIGESKSVYIFVLLKNCDYEKQTHFCIKRH